MKVRNGGNFELVTVCRSSNPVAFLRSESDQCRDLSATTARNIAITRVKASPIGTSGIGESDTLQFFEVGQAPTWRSRPTSSRQAQCSTIFPSTTRHRWMYVHATSEPLGSTPLSNGIVEATWRPRIVMW